MQASLITCPVWCVKRMCASQKNKHPEFQMTNLWEVSYSPHFLDDDDDSPLHSHTIINQHSYITDLFMVHQIHSNVTRPVTINPKYQIFELQLVPKKCSCYEGLHSHTLLYLLGAWDASRTGCMRVTMHPVHDRPHAPGAWSPS